MNTTTTAENFVLDNFTAVDFLTKENRVITLDGVSWGEYEMFLEDFEERTGWRLAYDGGRLEIMPPTPEHEEYSFSFHDFIRAYCEQFDINLEGRRSTTFRRKFLEKGVEPDECYYVQSAEDIAGKQLPNKDFPVPDVAVEVDITHGSLDKFSIYAALGVAELWIYDGDEVSFYELEAKDYHQISRSHAFPLLSAEKLTEFLKMSRTTGQTPALKNFRAWLREQK